MNKLNDVTNIYQEKPKEQTLLYTFWIPFTLFFGLTVALIAACLW